MENRCTDWRLVCSSLIVIVVCALTTCGLIQVSNWHVYEGRWSIL